MLALERTATGITTNPDHFAMFEGIASMGRCHLQVVRLGPAVVPCYLSLGEGSPTKIDYRKRSALILTSPLEDLGDVSFVPNSSELLGF